MSRLICPYSDDIITCIQEDTCDNIDCDKCIIKKETKLGEVYEDV